MSGMGSHQSTRMQKDEWLTPPEIFGGLNTTFDLDPCSPCARPWPTARKHYTIVDDGLRQPWDGFVWLNPPYGKHTGVWLDRLAEHGNGIALIFARTETRMFFDHVWGRADSIPFIRKRIGFYHADGSSAANNSGAPSCLIAYGSKADRVLQESTIDGAYVFNWSNTK